LYGVLLWIFPRNLLFNGQLGDFAGRHKSEEAERFEQLPKDSDHRGENAHPQYMFSRFIPVDES
jgi:hypothetical protein